MFRPNLVCPECGGDHYSTEHDAHELHHARLNDAVVKAAIEFIDNDTPENKESLYIARAALRDFEEEHKS